MRLCARGRELAAGLRHGLVGETPLEYLTRWRMQRAAGLLGRALYVAIFLTSAPMHFSPQMIGNAAQQGLPMPQLLVPVSGVITLLGGLIVLIGYRVRTGASLLVPFLVPVTLTMHNFGAVPDAMMAQIQFAMFMKNISMLGTACSSRGSALGLSAWTSVRRRGRGLDHSCAL